MKLPSFPSDDSPWFGPLIGSVVGAIMVVLAILLVRMTGISDLAFPTATSPTTSSVTYVDAAVAAELFKSCMAAGDADKSTTFNDKVDSCQEASIRLSTTTLPPNCMQVVILTNPVQYHCEKPKP